MGCSTGRRRAGRVHPAVPRGMDAAVRPAHGGTVGIRERLEDGPREQRIAVLRPFWPVHAIGTSAAPWATGDVHDGSSQHDAVAAAGFGIGMLRDDHFALLGPPQLSLHRAGQLRQDGFVARSAHPFQQAAPAEEQSQVDAGPAVHLDQINLRFIQFPHSGGEALIGIAAGIAGNHLPHIVRRPQVPGRWQGQRAVRPTPAGVATDGRCVSGTGRRKLPWWLAVRRRRGHAGRIPRRCCPERANDRYVAGGWYGVDFQEISVKSVACYILGRTSTQASSFPRYRRYGPRGRVQPAGLAVLL